MSEERKKLILSECKTKKAGRKQAALSDAELDKVTGGYWEICGYAAGFWIECPVCGRSGKYDFATWKDDEQRVDQFRCRCGFLFAVDSEGNYYF